MTRYIILTTFFLILVCVFFVPSSIAGINHEIGIDRYGVGLRSHVKMEFTESFATTHINAYNELGEEQYKAEYISFLDERGFQVDVNSVEITIDEGSTLVFWEFYDTGLLEDYGDGGYQLDMEKIVGMIPEYNSLENVEIGSSTPHTFSCDWWYYDTEGGKHYGGIITIDVFRNLEHLGYIEPNLIFKPYDVPGFSILTIITGLSLAIVFLYGINRKSS